ncbi:MAG: hypothetical protein ABR518_01000 [Actinomycetota bacterium]
MNQLLGPLMVPPKLILRALDDLHTLAESSTKLAGAVSELPKIERRVRDRLDTLERSLGSMSQLGEDMRRTVEQMRALQEAVLSLIRSTDALSLAIQPLEAFGRRMGRFADRFPRRAEASPSPRPRPPTA